MNFNGPEWKLHPKIPACFVWNEYYIYVDSEGFGTLYKDLGTDRQRLYHTTLALEELVECAEQDSLGKFDLRECWFVQNNKVIHCSAQQGFGLRLNVYGEVDIYKGSKCVDRFYTYFTSEERAIKALQDTAEQQIRSLEKNLDFYKNLKIKVEEFKHDE